LNIPAGKVERQAAIVIFAPSDKDVFFDDAKVRHGWTRAAQVTVVHSTAAAEAAGEDPAFDVSARA